MAKYKVDDWVRLKGQSKRECAHVIGVHEITGSAGIRTQYDIRLMRLEQFENIMPKPCLIVASIEIAEKIEEPKTVEPKPK